MKTCAACSAARTRRRPSTALRSYCLCLLLGYRGRYALAGGGEIETFVRQMREKIARFRGQMLFLRAGGPPPQVKQVKAIDRWSRGLGIAAFCLLLVMLLAFGGFWLALSSGVSQLG